MWLRTSVARNLVCHIVKRPSKPNPTASHCYHNKKKRVCHDLPRFPSIPPLVGHCGRLSVGAFLLLMGVL